VDLYGIQQELARNQMSVEQLHDEFAKRQKERIQGEQELREIREAYTEKHKLIKMERKKGESVLPPGRRCCHLGDGAVVVVSITCSMSEMIRS